MATKISKPPVVEAEAEALVRIRALTPVRHDGQDLPQDKVLVVNADAAAALLAAGLAELVRDDPADLSLA